MTPPFDDAPEHRARAAGGQIETHRPPGGAPQQHLPRSAGEQAEDQASESHGRAAVADSIIPCGPHNIPPRPWAYGTFLLRRSAAVLAAVDGGGKGAIATGIALSVITGRPMLGEKVWRTGPCAVVTYEDDMEEWHRRIAAACLHYSLDYETCLAGFRFLRMPDRRITFGSLDESGGVAFPDHDSTIAALTDMGAALLLVDPFNHAHALPDGNSNTMIARVAGEITSIAQEADVAALVLHHLRKGSTGNPDDLMGATSLRATFRSARILQRMAPETSKAMNIAEPWRYSRIAGSKENYAPPPEKATWYRLASVRLENGTDDYPDGDNIGVAETWHARAMFEGMDAPTLRAVFDALRVTVHGPAKQAKHTPWCGRPLMEIGGRSDREAGQIVKGWLESGVLEQGDYYHAPSKHTVRRVTLDDAKAAEILASLEVIDAPE